MQQELISSRRSAKVFKGERHAPLLNIECLVNQMFSRSEADQLELQHRQAISRLQHGSDDERTLLSKTTQLAEQATARQLLQMENIALLAEIAALKKTNVEVWIVVALTLTYFNDYVTTMHFCELNLQH